MIKKLEFRRAVKSEAPLLQDILSEAAHYKFARGDISWLKFPYDYEDAEDYVASGCTYFLIGDGEIVGTVALESKDIRVWGQQPEAAGYLHRLALKDAFHRQDLGVRTIEWAERAVAGRGGELLRLSCRTDAPGLRRYYENYGFQLVRTTQVDKDYLAALYERSVQREVAP